jgi:hypothetical protein
MLVPALILSVALAVTIHLRCWNVTAALGLAGIAMIAFLFSMIEVELKSNSRVEISRSGITTYSRPFAFTENRHYECGAIRELRASLQGVNVIELSAMIDDHYRVSLFTAELSDFSRLASHVAEILSMSYVVALNCPKAAFPTGQSPISAPATVTVDPAHRELIVRTLDSPPLSIPFEHIERVTVEGKTETLYGGCECSLPPTEYICQPAVHLTTGTLLLERFQCFESENMAESRAFVNAGRFADFLTQYFSHTDLASLLSHEEQLLSPPA